MLPNVIVHGINERSGSHLRGWHCESIFYLRARIQPQDPEEHPECPVFDRARDENHRVALEMKVYEPIRGLSPQLHLRPPLLHTSNFAVPNA